MQLLTVIFSIFYFLFFMVTNQSCRNRTNTAHIFFITSTVYSSLKNIYFKLWLWKCKYLWKKNKQNLKSGYITRYFSFKSIFLPVDQHFLWATFPFSASSCCDEHVQLNCYLFTYALSLRKRALMPFQWAGFKIINYKNKSRWTKICYEVSEISKNKCLGVPGGWFRG